MSSTTKNYTEPPLKKKNNPSIKPTSNPSLPDDLLLSCFARVSRLYYTTLSLVSKRFRSLLASPELYKARSLLNRTKSCLYVCLQFPSYDFNKRWYILCRKPNPTLTTKSSGYVLATFPISDSPPVYWSSLVAFGSNIYKIGGPNYKTPSSSVSILDCTSHTWLEAPSMQVERTVPSCSVVDGKIYVAGGCEDSLNSIEMFDTKTRIWQYVPSPNLKINGRSCISKSTCVEGKFYMMIEKQAGLAYNPKESKWDLVENQMGEMNGIWFSYCVIENILFCYSDKMLKWYDTKVRTSKYLKGLVGLPKFPRFSWVELANYGGNMAIMWNAFPSYNFSKEKTIWCAEIVLERDEDDEIWGKVEWFDGVLKVPDSCNLMKVLVVTL